MRTKGFPQAFVTQAACPRPAVQPVEGRRRIAGDFERLEHFLTTGKAQRLGDQGGVMHHLGPVRRLAWTNGPVARMIERGDGVRAGVACVGELRFNQFGMAFGADDINLRGAAIMGPFRATGRARC